MIRTTLSAATIAAVLLSAGAALAWTVAPAMTATVQAEAISEPAMAVPLRRTRGNDGILAGRPRIALAGYNLAPFVTSRVSASSRGGLTGFGARTSMSFELAGVDQPLFQRIADAAHADLVSQLEAAGFDVIPAHEVMAHAEAAPIRPREPMYQGQEPGTGSELLVVGPTGVGASAFLPIGRTVIGNMNQPARLSNALDAVLVFPSLALAFTETAGSGNRMFANRASAEGRARFSVDPMTKVEVIFSRAGRFSDGWTTLQVPNATPVDQPFGVVEQVSESNNNLAVALSAVLGAGMQRNQREGYVVNADPAAYEALALSAARGFNAAIVAQMVNARRGR